MEKTYKKEAEKPEEELYERLWNYKTQQKTQLRPTLFNVRRTAYLNIAQCYEQETKSIAETEKCVESAHYRANEFKAAVSMSWATHLAALKHCIKDPSSNEPVDYNKCFDNFATAMQADTQMIQNKFA